jgi:hypothetical protein
MAASTFSPALSTPSSSISKILKPVSKPFSLGFATSVSKDLKALRVTTPGFVGGSALGARMVSMPAIKPLTSLDFETKLFKKEKVNLAGHDEVFHLIFIFSRSPFGSREMCEGKCRKCLKMTSFLLLEESNVKNFFMVCLNLRFDLLSCFLGFQTRC